MDESAKIDANQQKTLLAVTNAATPEIKNVRCDATTGRVLVSATVSGVSDITVANEATDTSCFPLFATAATGSIQPKTNAGLTFNSNTGNLGATLMHTQKLTVGVAGTATGSIELNGTTSGTVTLKTADAAGTYTLTLPTNDGNANQFLQTNGNGVLTWADITVSGGASTALDNLVNVAINTSLVSDTDNTDDLGSSTKAWKSLYVNGIELGHATANTLTASSGVLSIEGTVIPTISSTNTLTNKRVTPRIITIESNAEPTINTDNCDCVTITALATDITSMTTNLSGTPTNFQKLIIRIKDNGTARAIAWGASFEAKGVDLPTTTVISKVLTVGFIYDTVTSKWGCVASAQEE